MSATIKLKELSDRSRDLTWLAMTTDKRVSLNYKKAQLLAKNERSYFVPFSFAENGNKAKGQADLYYFISDLMCLEEYLQCGVSALRLRELMMQIVRMFSVCEERGFIAKNILLDISRCYIYPQTSLLKFVYLPLQGFSTEDNALHVFLMRLAEIARPADSNAAGYRATVLDFFRRQEVFSLFKLRQFIDPQGEVPKIEQKQNHMPGKQGEQPTALYRDFVRESIEG